MDTRFEALLSQLPEAASALAWRIRQQILVDVPDCEEAYHGGSRAGIATYRLADGPAFCRLQARASEVRLFFPAGAEPGSATGSGNGVRMLVDDAPDMPALRAALAEALRFAGHQQGMRLAG